MKTKNPGAGKRQGFSINQVSRKDFDTAASTKIQPDFRAAEWLAVRAGVAVETARVHAELFGIGGRL